MGDCTGERGRKKCRAVEEKEFGKGIEGKNSYDALLAIEEEINESGSEDSSGDSAEEMVTPEDLTKELLKNIKRIQVESGGKIKKEEAVRMITKAMGMDE